MTEDRFLPKERVGSRAGILGLGRSGVSAANLLATHSGRFAVLASDARPAEKLAADLARLSKSVQVETGGHTDALLACDFIVKSPGILPSAPILAKLKEKGKTVFSEIEVGLAFCPPAVQFAVTGTNGKTTTTALLGAIISESGTRTHVGGNIGAPVSDFSMKVRPMDALVLEVSSYQLEDSRYFHPDVGAILNLTPDHLDHHGSAAAYQAAKAKIFTRMTLVDYCVFNDDDQNLEVLASVCPARKLYFGLKRSPRTNAWMENGKIHIHLDGTEADLAPPALPGEHNLHNAMTAALMALARDVPTAAVQRAFSKFQGVEHRLESAGEVRGVKCVNDSKATNVDSTRIALRALADRGRTLWVILGGLDKGVPYAPLRPLLEAQAKGVAVIGQAAPKIEKELAGIPIAPCGTLDKAVETVLAHAAPGDTMLLSPACASFDQFNDYEHRGRVFKELVKKHAQIPA